MYKKTWSFVFPVFLVSVLLAILISPFASSSPDGLEKVAEEKGFLAKAEDEPPAWKHAPIPDYAVGSTENESLATALAGLIGTALTFAVGLGLAKVIASKKKAQKPLQES